MSRGALDGLGTTASLVPGRSFSPDCKILGAHCALRRILILRVQMYVVRPVFVCLLLGFARPHTSWTVGVPGGGIGLLHLASKALEEPQ